METLCSKTMLIFKSLFRSARKMLTFSLKVIKTILRLKSKTFGVLTSTTLKSEVPSYQQSSRIYS